MGMMQTRFCMAAVAVYNNVNSILRLKNYLMFNLLLSSAIGCEHAYYKIINTNIKVFYDETFIMSN